MVTRGLLFIGLPSLLAAGLLFALLPSGPSLAAHPLDRLPADVGVYGFVRLKKVMSSEVFRETTRKAGLPEKSEAFEVCGFEPLDQVQDAAMFARKGEKDLVWAIAAKGDFDRLAFADCIKKLVGETDPRIPGGLEETEIDGLAALQSQGQKLAAFTGSDGAVLGHRSAVQELLDVAKRGNEGHAAADAEARDADALLVVAPEVLYEVLPLMARVALRGATEASLRVTTTDKVAVELSVRFDTERARARVSRLWEEVSEGGFPGSSALVSALRAAETQWAGPKFSIRITADPSTLADWITTARSR